MGVLRIDLSRENIFHAKPLDTRYPSSSVSRALSILWDLSRIFSMRGGLIFVIQWVLPGSHQIYYMRLLNLHGDLSKTQTAAPK